MFSMNSTCNGIDQYAKDYVQIHLTEIINTFVQIHMYRNLRFADKTSLLGLFH